MKFGKETDEFGTEIYTFTLTDPLVPVEDVLDDEAIDTDIASVIPDWYERGHDVFDTDEVCAAYVRGYKSGFSIARTDQMEWLKGLRAAASEPPIEPWLLAAIQERMKGLK